MVSGGTGERGKKGEDERRRKFDEFDEIKMNDRGAKEALLAMNELKMAAAKQRYRNTEVWRDWGKEEGRRRKRSKERKGGVVSYETAAGGMPRLWGG